MIGRVFAVFALVTLACRHIQPTCGPSRFTGAPFPSQWIIRTATTQEIEHKIDEIVASVQDGKIPESAVRDVRASVEDPWLRVKKQMRPGDTLWYYKSPPETWAGLYGREGYLLVRDCRVVADYLFAEN